MLSLCARRECSDARLTVAAARGVPPAVSRLISRNGATIASSARRSPVPQVGITGLLGAPARRRCGGRRRPSDPDSSGPGRVGNAAVYDRAVMPGQSDRGRRGRRDDRRERGRLRETGATSGRLATDLGPGCLATALARRTCGSSRPSRASPNCPMALGMPQEEQRFRRTRTSAVGPRRGEYRQRPSDADTPCAGRRGRRCRARRSAA